MKCVIVDTGDVLDCQACGRKWPKFPPTGAPQDCFPALASENQRLRAENEKQRLQIHAMAVLLYGKPPNTAKPTHLVERLRAQAPDNAAIQDAAEWIDRASALLPLIKRHDGSPLAREVRELLDQQPPMVRRAPHPSGKP